MISNSMINEILGIKENYQAVEKLHEVLFGGNKNEVFDIFLNIEPDLSYDWFNKYFQETQSNRKDLMQDYTPTSICEIVSKLVTGDCILDMCSGTGSLTIKAWQEDKNRKFCCEEFSEMSFNFLLFNLSIRGISGYAVNKDCISGEIKRCYKLTKIGKYSEIEECEEPKSKYSCVITNPPYSMQWDSGKYANDPRFKYGFAPNSKADYAFVQIALDKLEDAGRAVAILPHGVLFRGNKEYLIRKSLLENKLISAVIGMPSNMFLNTSIPTAIVVLEKSEDVLFIDSSKQYTKDNKFNILNREQIDKISKCFLDRREEDKFSTISKISEIKENDYNLNIPRYVDTYEKEPIPPLNITINELVEIEREIIKTRKKLITMMKDLTSTDRATQEDLKSAIRRWDKLSKEEQLKLKL